MKVAVYRPGGAPPATGPRRIDQGAVAYGSPDELVAAVARGEHQVVVLEAFGHGSGELLAQLDELDVGWVAVAPRRTDGEVELAIARALAPPASRGGRPRAPVDVELARVLLRQGLGVAEVARRLGVSRRTLERRLGRKASF